MNNYELTKLKVPRSVINCLKWTTLTIQKPKIHLEDPIPLPPEAYENLSLVISEGGHNN